MHDNQDRVAQHVGEAVREVPFLRTKKQL